MYLHTLSHSLFPFTNVRMHAYPPQNVEYRSRIAISEWSKLEYELTRERGLWGPANSSSLDKWCLDTVEGMHTLYRSTLIAYTVLACY